MPTSTTGHERIDFKWSASRAGLVKKMSLEKKKIMRHNSSQISSETELCGEADSVTPVKTNSGSAEICKVPITINNGAASTAAQAKRNGPSSACDDELVNCFDDGKSLDCAPRFGVSTSIHTLNGDLQRKHGALHEFVAAAPRMETNAATTPSLIEAQVEYKGQQLQFTIPS